MPDLLTRHHQQQRLMVKALLSEYHASIRCGCAPSLDHLDWARIQFTHVGTHTPECLAAKAASAKVGTRLHY